MVTVLDGRVSSKAYIVISLLALFIRTKKLSEFGNECAQRQSSIFTGRKRENHFMEYEINTGAVILRYEVCDGYFPFCHLRVPTLMSLSLTLHCAYFVKGLQSNTLKKSVLNVKEKQPQPISNTKH